ncbi:SDR family oxidoreductase [Bacillus sp. FJAT-49736]|uniref:SDR family NAD(P)-dependent oxidoreductase n=1 Tax=Bacillus sp. FJAT-49736 TaxID=2833582 RepID=UPI001BC9FB76|nr:SDR family oxidoreductase [Bacillus sp. FJAT-49736]MBS4173382.1 SDR family oxidoreductase [Bacillus sp. FJAT-49736]
MVNEKLKGKTVVITGASGGLGEQIAFTAARNGANVVLLARNHDKLCDLKQRIDAAFSVKCMVERLDVSNTEEIPKVFQKIQRDFGPIDVLVNNAGYGIFDEAHEATLEDIQGMFNVNVIGLIACTKEVLPFMREKKSGHIINIASQAGKLATPKSSAYAATKHAVIGFSNSLRMELAPFHVFVTTVNPGPIATQFFDIADKSGTYIKNIERYMLDPEKLAEIIVQSMFTKRREINLPRWMNAGSILYTLFPMIVEKVGGKAFYKK